MIHLVSDQYGNILPGQEGYITEMGKHQHNYQIVSRVKQGDIIYVTYRCSCGDSYVEQEYT